MNNTTTVRSTGHADPAKLVTPTVNKSSSVPYNNYTRNMKNTKSIIEKSIWFTMNCVAWGLTAVLAWSFILAVFHITETSVPQWLLPF